jgi:hypothetical protein
MHLFIYLHAEYNSHGPIIIIIIIRIYLFLCICLFTYLHAESNNQGTIIIIIKIIIPLIIITNGRNKKFTTLRTFTDIIFLVSCYHSYAVIIG